MKLPQPVDLPSLASQATMSCLARGDPGQHDIEDDQHHFHCRKQRADKCALWADAGDEEVTENGQKPHDTAPGACEPKADSSNWVKHGECHDHRPDADGHVLEARSTEYVDPENRRPRP